MYARSRVGGGQLDCVRLASVAVTKSCASVPTRVSASSAGERIARQGISRSEISGASRGGASPRRDTLGREPEPAGLAAWVAVAQNGTPIATIASCFYGSGEYLAVIAGGDRCVWITDLYRKLLFRSPDGPGQAGWLAALDRGPSWAEIALGFYQAEETLRLRVNNLYGALLGRCADPTGLTGWSRVVAAEGDLALAAALASSEEYWERAQNR